MPKPETIATETSGRSKNKERLSADFAEPVAPQDIRRSRVAFRRRITQVSFESVARQKPPITFPAHFVLAIELSNDSVGNVIGANFNVTDPFGNTAMLTADLPPLDKVWAFELDIGGPFNCSHAAFSSPPATMSPVGTITYAASNNLCLAGIQGLPSGCTGLLCGSTIESSNITYGPMGGFSFSPLEGFVSTCCDQSSYQRSISVSAG